MNTACIIYSDDSKYDKLQNCAIKSFKKFHPEIKIYYTNLKVLGNYKSPFKNSGFNKFLFAYNIAKKHEIKKIIILGADTITCGRLDEFLNNNETDILTTLDYPYQLVIENALIDNNVYGRLIPNTNLFLSTSANDHVNADVVCFNNIKALEEIINCFSWLKTIYYEQAVLNYICNVQKKFSSKIVDGDYINSDVVYNARSKGNIVASAGQRPWFKYTNKFQVIDNKLYTGIHEHCPKSKQIKVWHYCEGFGNLSNDQLNSRIDAWINDGFNEETKAFFSDQCDCKDFFQKLL